MGVGFDGFAALVGEEEGVGVVRVDPISSPKLTQIERQSLLNSPIVVKTVEDSSLGVSAAHVPQRVEGDDEVLRHVS